MAQPHDRLVRVLLDDVDRMASILDRLADPPLPCGPVRGRLVRLRDVLIDPDLRRSEPDFLYAIDEGEKPSDLIVVEHLSQQVPNAPVRALSHMSTLYQDVDRSEGPGARVPHVDVVVLYHGAHPWTAPREFMDLYARKPADPHRALNVVVHVIDLGRFEDAEIRALLGVGAATLLILLLNHSREKGIRTKLLEWDDLFRATVEEKGGLSLLRTVVWYLYFVSNIDPEEVLGLPFTQVSEEAKVMVRTTAERLMEEGRTEGLREGLRKGLEALLLARFAQIPQQLRDIIAAADSETLEDLLCRAPSAETPTDLLDDAAP